MGESVGSCLNLQLIKCKKTFTKKGKTLRPLCRHHVWLVGDVLKNRALAKFFLTCHPTLWQLLDWAAGHYTYRKTCRDRTCHSPHRIHPDAQSASVRSTNEKPSQPMLQSSSWGHSMDWLNAILPVKRGWACWRSRRRHTTSLMRHRGRWATSQETEIMLGAWTNTSQ